MQVVVVGTYPPTPCGIATFTSDVESALRFNGAEVTVVPVSPVADPSRLSIARDVEDCYVDVARRINDLGCDVVLIQHEFGIYGGYAGAHILALAEALTVPYVVTLHTVLARFTDDQADVIHDLCRRAAGITVFTNTARRLLIEQELAPARLLHVVAHGAPPELYSASDTVEARGRFQMPERVPVMSTFGLLSSGKGIELAIEAMGHLTESIPELHYVVAGRTHPEVLKLEGESYRTSLRELTEHLGLAERVLFVDRFLDLPELAALLGISSVVCTPYRGEDQSVSGVLTFSLAAGCAVASTPYRYARDVLGDGAGMLSDFGNSEGLAHSIANLLNEDTGNTARAAARRAAAAMRWPTVSAALRAVLETATQETMATARVQSDWAALDASAASLATTHLAVLCDDTAMWQHAHYSVPRLEHGYCVDDASRMLPVAADLFLTTRDTRWQVTTARLLAFVRWAGRGGDGEMRNFMSADRRWLDEPHLGDHVGRAVWGIGELIASDCPFTADARDMMATLAPTVSPHWSTRTLAYAALGLVAASTHHCMQDDNLGRIVDKLHEWAPAANPSWRWFEKRLTYDNARLPEVLIRVGHRLGDEKLIDDGLTLLFWLDDLCRQGDHYRFPGDRGLSDMKRLTWSGDEQPLEATALADAHLAALTCCNEAASAEAIERVWTWFLGNNRAGQPVVEFDSGACYDGVGSRHVNRNRGAEATIALHRFAMTRAAANLLLPGRVGASASESTDRQMLAAGS